MSINPHCWLIRLNCVIIRYTAVIVMNEGNIPKMRVIFIIVLRDLKRKRDMTYAVRIVSVVPIRLLMSDINSVFKNQRG